MDSQVTGAAYEKDETFCRKKAQRYQIKTDKNACSSMSASHCGQPAAHRFGRCHVGEVSFQDTRDDSSL
ncbi:unnamed protein product [Ranitomeya imitator]|uniref:Uncharacterized protein n=1 Tax=Ranitomeya imitator TaxID=111125 RepID=A0ABN9L2M0_9NEOB|nr:unnamed protein product [Ranitomeya imitator]